MISNFSPMASRLAAIEARGLSWLDRRSRIAALRRALWLSLPILPVMPLVGLALGWVVPVRAEMIAGSALVVSGLRFAGAYAVARRGHREAARAGLALHDMRLGLKDRLRTADEFLARGEITGFHGAAIVEAEPWVAYAQAAQMPMDQPGAPPGRQRLLWVAFAIALVAATYLQQHVYRPAATSAMAKAVANAIAAVPGLNSVLRYQTAANGSAAKVASQGIGPAKAASGGGPSDTDQAGSLEAGAGRGSRPLGAGEAGQRSGAAGGVSGIGFGATSGQAVRSSSRAEEVSVGNAISQPGEGSSKAGDRSNVDGAGLSDGAATAQANAASSSQSAPGSQSPSGAMPPGQPQSSHPASGPGQPKQNRSQQNTQNQSQESGQGQGSGSQGRRDGQDAMKSARGALSLMLAVPMQDRLGGIANPGPVTSVTREGSPRAGASGHVAAQVRGSLDGDAGRLEHRPMTPHERRLMRDYFRPAGSGY